MKMRLELAIHSGPSFLIRGAGDTFCGTADDGSGKMRFDSLCMADSRSGLSPDRASRAHSSTLQLLARSSAPLLATKTLFSWRVHGHRSSSFDMPPLAIGKHHLGLTAVRSFRSATGSTSSALFPFETAMCPRLWAQRKEPLYEFGLTS